MSGTLCRNALKEMGLPYPRSSCAKCGSLLRPGWRCADRIEQRPAGVSGAMAGIEPAIDREQSLSLRGQEVSKAIWAVIDPLEGDPDAAPIVALALGAVLGSFSLIATEPDEFIDAVVDVARSVKQP